MKKIFKAFALLGVTAVFTCAAALCGCNKKDPEDKNEPEIPEIQYTTDDAFITQCTANDEQFDPENVTMRDNSPLKNKKIYWLGSSVTDGANSEYNSMA